MNIKITRESVCAADDLSAPHEKIIRNIEKKNISSILEEIKDKYLPQNVTNGSTWVVYQNKERIGIIEYPKGIIKSYKSKEYKITNNQIALYAKCIGSIPIDHYDNQKNESTFVFISVSDDCLVYKENNENKKINLIECIKNWEEYVNNSSEFNVNNYSSHNCIGYVDSSKNPILMRIFGSDQMDFLFKTHFESLQIKLFKYRRWTFKKMNKVKNQIIKAGYNLYDYS